MTVVLAAIFLALSVFTSFSVIKVRLDPLSMRALARCCLPLLSIVVTHVPNIMAVVPLGLRHTDSVVDRREVADDGMDDGDCPWYGYCRCGGYGTG